MCCDSRGPRHPKSGDLEVAYWGAVDQLCLMVAQGTFPFPFEDAVTEGSPRVGDGMLLLDRSRRVVYSSPNAVSALHQSGYHGNVRGRRLQDLGFDSDAASSAYRLQVPVTDELERGERSAILAWIVPLLDDGSLTGALVLLRDVSDLRRRERMLLSKDATIREIHHRVKNNLQTVSSLLRIQGRRLASEEAKVAIEESVRRIAAIAVVHEMLARSGGDDVDFAEVVRPVLRMAETALVTTDRPVALRLVGEGPIVSASKASSLAVVITELIQNAVEHGYPDGSPGGTVTVEMIASPDQLTVRVHDDGVGLPADFTIEESKGLGLTIILALVSGELGGELKIRPATAPKQGAVAQVVVQLADDDR